jgi:hypothetical protein
MVGRTAVRRAAAKALLAVAGSSLVVSMVMVPAAGDPVEPSAPASGPVAKEGDLSHLVYTARTGLVAHAITPDDGGIVNASATSFEVATIAGAGVELAVNGEVVPVKKLGKRAELEDGSVRYTYYGVVLSPGINHVVLTPLGADGLRGPSVNQRVWGPGAPVALHATGCAKPRADGRTPCAVRIAVVDGWGHPAAPGVTLKVLITSGEAVILTTGITGGDALPDSVSPTGGAAGQRSIAVVLSVGSTATIQVVPGGVPGRIRLAAAIADVSGIVQLDAMAVPRPPIVTGLATVGIGAVPGEPGSDPTVADGTNSRNGRVALFGTGSVGGNAVGSLAYDTAGSLAATTSTGMFNADPNDRPYATYGDASIRRNDALTQDRLFARFDDGYNSAMWGEFQATTGPQGSAGTVALQVDGAKIAVGSAVTSASVFTAANQVGYGRQVLDPTGLATLDTLAHNNLVVGSETVTLVSTDRRTGVVLNQTLLQSVADYTIDYTSGIIHFINIPLPYDDKFNPQQVLVTYEYSALSGGARTTGARFDAPFGRFDNIKFGLGYLNDETGIANFTLLTQNAGGLLPGGSWTFSHAASNGVVPGISEGTANGSNTGSAYRFGGSSASGPYKVSFGYDTASPGYGNPFGDLATPGLTDYHGTLLRTFGEGRGDLSFSYDREVNAALTAGGGSAAESNFAATLRERLNSRLALRAGLAFHDSDTTAASVDSGDASATATDQHASVAQANLGLDWKVLKNLAFSAERDQTVGGFDATQPAQTTAQASWDLNGHGRIYAKELLSDAPVQSFGSMSSVAAASRAFTVGVEQKVDANTTVDSEYAVSGTGNAKDVNAAIGVKQRLMFSRDLKGDAFIQRGVGVGSIDAGFTVYGLSLAYGDAAGRIKATGSLQDRTGEGGGASWSLGAAGKLFGDVSLLGAYAGSRALGSDTADARISLAWRPSTSDRGALFVGYARAAGNANVAGAQSGVVSLDGVYRPARRLELTGRYAQKTDGDSNYAVGTSLVGLGVRQQIGPRFDAGIETRTVLSRSAGGGLHSTAAELGAMIGGTLRAAVGFNFGTTADPTLAAAPTRKGIYATVTTVIDRIFGWGAH